MTVNNLLEKLLFFLFFFMLFFQTVCIADNILISTHFQLENDFKTVFAYPPVNNSEYSIVSITKYDEKSYFICDYQDISILCEENGYYDRIKIKKPNGINRWVPTGLFYDNISDILYVANYKGEDILTFKYIDKNHSLELITRITDLNLKGPENVVMNNSNIYVADYDSGYVLCFDRNGVKKWDVYIGQAHGIAIHNGYVYASSLLDRTIYKISLEGNIIDKKGSLGVNPGYYQWPVSICSLDDKYLAIVDAHQSRINIIDSDLNPIQIIGGLGPGVNLLNYPYCIINVNDEIIVIDTFKKRILFFTRNWTIFQIINFDNEDILMKNGTVIIGTQKNPYSYPTMRCPSIFQYFGINDSNSSNNYFGGFSSIDQGNSKGITNKDGVIQEICIDSPNLLNLSLNEGFFYTTWGKIIQKTNYGPLLIIGSPQNSFILIFDNKTMCWNSVEIFPNIWLNTGEIVDDNGNGIDLESYLDDSTNKFRQIQNLLDRGYSREKALHDVFYPDYTDKEFDDIIHAYLSFSLAGKTFYKDYFNNQDVSFAVDKYINSIMSEYNVYIKEAIMALYLAGYSVEDYSRAKNFSKNCEISKYFFEILGSPCYLNYSIMNAFDGDPDDDYAATIETPFPQFFELSLSKPVNISEISIIWESEENYGIHYEFENIDSSTNTTIETLAEVFNGTGKYQDVSVNQTKPLQTLKFIVYSTAGQQRTLLRQLKVYSRECPGEYLLKYNSPENSSFSPLSINTINNKIQHENQIYNDDLLSDISALLTAVNSSPMYPGFNISNAFDDDPDDDYAAAIETPFPQFFELSLSKPVNISEISIIWESEENYGIHYEFENIDSSTNTTIETLAEVFNGAGKYQNISINQTKPLQTLKFIVYSTAGQQRTLLRKISFASKNIVKNSTPQNNLEKKLNAEDNFFTSFFFNQINKILNLNESKLPSIFYLIEKLKLPKIMVHHFLLSEINNSSLYSMENERTNTSMLDILPKKQEFIEYSQYFPNSNDHSIIYSFNKTKMLNKIQIFSDKNSISKKICLELIDLSYNYRHYNTSYVFFINSDEGGIYSLDLDKPLKSDSVKITYTLSDHLNFINYNPIKEVKFFSSLGPENNPESSFETSRENLSFTEKNFSYTDISDEIKIQGYSPEIINMGTIFDDNIEDGSISFPNQVDQYIDFTFGRETKINSIILNWDNDIGPIDYSVYDIDCQGNIFKKIISISNIEKNLHEINFSSPEPITSFRLKIDDQKNNDKLKLVQIKVNGSLPDYIQQLVLNDTFDPYLAGNDIQNPLMPYGYPINQSVKTIADKLLSEAKLMNLSPHKTVLYFMSLPGMVTKDGQSFNGNPRDTLLTRLGQCGGVTYLTSALLASIGVENRIIYTYGFPSDTSGHVVLECKINDKWQLYDPLVGGFYTTTPENGKDPIVLSLDDLMNISLINEPIYSIITSYKSHFPLHEGYLNPVLFNQSDAVGYIIPNGTISVPVPWNINLNNNYNPNNHIGTQWLGRAEINKSLDFELNGHNPGYLYVLFINGSFNSNMCADLEFNITNGTIISQETNLGNYPQSICNSVIYSPSNKIVHFIISIKSENSSCIFFPENFKIMPHT